jgi:quinol monooxygenase YgiN
VSKVLTLGICPVRPEKVDSFERLGRELAERRRKPDSQPSGWHSLRIYRAVEDPSRFLIHGTWDSVDAHMRSVGSNQGQEVTEVLSSCLASDEIVYHYELVEGAEAGEVTL